MAEIWAAAAALVTAGTAAYGAYNASQTPDSPSDVFGKKPKVAPYTPIDLATEQGRATRSNISNAADIVALLDRFAPGFSDTLRTGLETSRQLVSGQIPQDVQDAVLRNDAYQSLMGGFSGSQMSRNLTARDLGRTSLDLTQMGANSAQLWTSLAEGAYKPYLITTQDEVAAAAANNLGQQETQQRQFSVNAAPDPAAAGMYNLGLAQNQALQQSISQFGSALSTFGRQYSQQGSALRPYVGQSYVYDVTTGTYQPSPTG